MMVEPSVRPTIRKVVPADWDAVEALFGPNGVCGGCWCMNWHHPTGTDWHAVNGERNKASFYQALVAGRIHAVMAWNGTQPVGWCQFGPRASFAKLVRSPKLRRDPDPGLWSVVCLFVRRPARRQGLASAMLSAAAVEASALGATEVEGFPVRPRNAGKIPDVFAFTGVPAMFESAGFVPFKQADAGKEIWTLDVKHRRSGDAVPDMPAPAGKTPR